MYKVCSIEDCDSKYYAKDWCYNHYMRVFRTGKTQQPGILERFHNQIDKLPGNGLIYDYHSTAKPLPIILINNNCWIWQGYIRNTGYGTISVNGREETAHRVSYVLFVSSILESYQLDHLCLHRSCVNPSHLEMVTREENSRRVKRYRERNL